MIGKAAFDGIEALAKRTVGGFSGRSLPAHRSVIRLDSPADTFGRSPPNVSNLRQAEMPTRYGDQLVVIPTARAEKSLLKFSYVVSERANR